MKSGRIQRSCGAAMLLAVGLLVAQARGDIFIDFGASSGSGATTASPDLNGNHWNNIGDHTTNGPVYSLVDTLGVGSGIGLEITDSFTGPNGMAAGGGLLTPNAAWLGDFAIETATEDYFFFTSALTPQLTITGLNASLSYNLTFFGSRSNTITRETQYVATGGNGTFSTNLLTSGAGIGSSGYNGNNDTVVTLSGITPDGSNRIIIDLASTQGGFGYLNLLGIQAVPEPGSVVMLLLGGSCIGWVLRRRRVIRG